MILAIRTDKPEAELHLVDSTGTDKAHFVWEAHRSLASTLLTTILQFLSQQGVKPKRFPSDSNTVGYARSCCTDAL